MQTNPLDQLVERLEGSAKIERVCGDEMFARELEAAATLLLSQQETIARLTEALRIIRDGDEPRPVGKMWRADAKPSKNDKCVHDRWMYEDCGECVAEVARSTLSPIRRET